MKSSRSARAPGRVNLIGEHVDYAGGSALPLAIRQGSRVHWVKTAEALTAFSSFDNRHINLATPHKDDPGWAAIVAKAAALTGCDRGRLEIDGDLPIGAGLSSSTSLAVALVLALGGEMNEDDLIAASWECEQALGTPTGFLDQQAIVAGKEGQCLLIDFSTMKRRLVALDPQLHLYVIHSGIERELLNSPYAKRRTEVRQAEDLLGPLPRADREAVRSLSDSTLGKRALHVVEECERVHAAAHALEDGNLKTFGGLLNESHTSLRDLFDVSLARIDQLVEDLQAKSDVLGARLMGGGFGGCILAASSRELDFGTDLTWWKVEAAAGASVHED
ncbi:MAG: galactokinase family protein [Actinomycetes bacterium]